MAIEDLIKSRLEKLKEARRKGIEPYPYSYNRKAKAAELHRKFDSLKAGEETEHITSIAGRIMGIRDMGKLVFIDIMDETAKIQVVARSDVCKNFSDLELFDLGDFAGVEGKIIKTKRNELSILATEITLLCKSIRPLPEKWHGLKDVELRYRKRYLDLIMNPEVREVFIKRTQIIDALHEFLKKRGFLEVEIPLLQPVYGGAAAKPFITHSNALDRDLYLSISPELYLKRLIIGGFEKVYTVCKNFRNESIDKEHNPEFTMMECYWAYVDYNDIMKLTEELITHIVKKVHGKFKVKYQGKEINFKPPWKRMTMKEALKEIAGFEVDKMKDKEILEEIEKHKAYEGPMKRGYLIAELFELHCEEELIQPTFITDHPKETTPLCKIHRKDPELIERFELYINGMELANAYSELNDPIVQRQLFEEQEKETKLEEKHPKDTDFLEALEYGMPPTGGLGIGIDRLVMLLTDQPTIKDVILFPQMRT
ncbi:MAG: lysine--tRNA ligase [Candidatus Diapherotrites archaeon]|nr:lysine--tRNA ligase [Candidatus Diapherotrites archaeon]